MDAPGRRMGKRKSFVLDTNVLLYDPGALFKFADNDVVGTPLRASKAARIAQPGPIQDRVKHVAGAHRSFDGTRRDARPGDEQRHAHR